MSIDWNPDLFHIGIEILDTQHEKLFQALNKLHNAYSSENEKIVLDEVINFLGTYLIQHFQTEEEYMRSKNYEGIEGQINEHRRFIEVYNTLKNSYDTEGASKKLIMSIYNYVSKWLVDHISGMDMKIPK